MKPTHLVFQSRILLGLILAFFAINFSVHSQTLLYEWNFTNNDGIFGTPTNMPPAYAGTNQAGVSLAGSGSLNIINIYGAGAGANFFFTNGPGVGPGIVGVPNSAHPEYGSSSANGAYVAQGGGYNGGSPASEAQGTNLNLGTMYRYTFTFWFQLGSSMGGRYPRIVMLGNVTNYDEATAGIYGNAASLNNWNNTVSPSVAQSMQNDLSGTSQANGVTTALPANFTNSTGVSGIVCDGSTWYFCAEEYNGSTNSGQWTSWLGTSTTNVVRIDSQNLAFLGIPFGTNACIQIAGSLSGKRNITDGQIADVRLYAGNCNSNNLEAIRTLNMEAYVDDGSGNGNTAPVVQGEPVSGSSYMGGSRSFSVSVSGLAPLHYQWSSNNVPLTGATNFTLTLTNIPLSANNASFVCTITNGIGTNSSSPVILNVYAPSLYGQAVIVNNPYIYWRLNEGTNLDGLQVNLSDYVNGLDGTALDPANTLLQLPAQSAPNYPGFVTTNVAIETLFGVNPSRLNMVPLPVWTNGMTICAWINTYSTPESHAIVYSMIGNDGGGTFSDGYGLAFSGTGTDINGNPGGQLSYNWNSAGVGNAVIGTGTPFQSGLIVPSNEWTFVAVTIDPTGAFATLYMGSHSTGLQSSIDDTNATGDIIASTANFAPPIVLGRSVYGYFEGTGEGGNNLAINDVAIYYSALSASAITNLYQAGAGVSLPVLTGVPDPGISGNLLLTWTFGTLQEASVVSGPYTDVAGPPASPYSVPMTRSQHYYRVSN